MSAEVLQFPEYKPEPLEPVSELIAAKPELYARLLGAEALEPTIVLGED